MQNNNDQNNQILEKYFSNTAQIQQSIQNKDKKAFDVILSILLKDEYKNIIFLDDDKD